MNFNYFPDWFGTAIIAALFALLGFIGRNIFELLKKRRNKKENSIRQLEKLKNLVNESRNIFYHQNYLVKRLSSSLKSQHGEGVINGLGYDESFYKHYEQMNNEQRDLFNLIRGISLNSLRRTNEELQNWVNENTARELVAKNSSRAKQFETELDSLRQHLNTWFDKYNSILKTSEKRSLVYLSDEKGHGKRFPPELANTIEILLAELEGRPIPSLQTHVFGRGASELDVEALRYFIGIFSTFNTNMEGQWRNIENRWAASSESWRDGKKSQSSDSIVWDDVLQAMEIYFSTSQRYVDFLKRLEQRIREYE